VKARLASALLLACLALPALVRAEPTTSLVVLISEQPGDAVSDRLERDLRSQGLAVLVLSATPENSSSAAALEQTARGLGGIAAVRVLADARGSELWVLDPQTSRSVKRSLSRPAGTTADPNEIALGTLELLRASLLELHQPAAARSREAAPPPGPEPPPAPAPTVVTPPVAWLSLSGGLAADLGLRSVGPSLTTLWAAWLRLGGCFGARGFVSLPLLAERADVPEGQVEVEPTLLGVGLTCGLARPSSLFSPRVSLGFASAHVTTRGTAHDPLASSSESVWLAGGYGLLGVGVHLTRDVRLNLDATGVLLPTPAVIVVDRRELGTWGAPGGIVSLGLEVLTSR
jgi:hypothetical protein